MTAVRSLSVATVVLVLVACFALGQIAPKGESGTVVQLDSPAGPGSAQPNLTSGNGGYTYLSWIEPAGKGHVLRFSSRPPGGAWSRPQTITQGEDWFVSWADFPSMLALSDGSLVANWLVNTNPIIEAYDTHLTLSKDGGKTWSQPITPHRDQTENQHGFLSMVPAANGGFLAVWLDGRHMEDTLDMGLMYTTVSANGELGPEIAVDNRVCECCQTSAAATPNGMIVAYRDRSDMEIRDISVARLSDGRWSSPQTVFHDGWQIDGCPINGPSIAAIGSTVSVAWFTAPNDKLEVKTAFSLDGGAKFNRPIRIDEGRPIGRVDVLAISSNQSLVSWIERVDKGAQIRARYVRADGTPGASMVVSEISPALSSGFPRMERAGNEIVFAWTDVGSDSVRTAVLKR